MTHDLNHCGADGPHLARSFLAMLDPDCGAWEFRTFDDDKARKDPSLTRSLRGRLDEISSALREKNHKGAGVFVAINQTDGRGRRAPNVIRVRALFADTDGAELSPLLALTPHIVVRSSPNRWHCYWRVRDCELSQFKPLQKAIIQKYGTDQAVHDLPRVMRLPGFQHRKGEPHLVDFDRDSMEPARDAYSVQELVDGLGLNLPKTEGAASSVEAEVRSGAKNNERKPPSESAMRAMLEHLLEKGFFEDRTGVANDDQGRIVKLSWIETGMALKSAYGDDPGKDLWAITHFNERAYTDAPRQWASFASQEEPGQITVGTIIKASRDAGFVESAPLDAEMLAEDAGDVANGRAFARMFRDKLLYVFETGEWLRFEPVRGWASAPFGEADRAAKEVLEAMRREVAEHWREAPHDPNTKALMRHVNRTCQATHLRAMIEMAKSEPGMCTSLRDMDADNHLLGVANGIVNLRTGGLVHVDPDVRVSKRCGTAFDPDVKCPRFEQFLSEIQPDPEVRNFLQRWCGYTLSGLTDEQKFVFFHGPGANGKSVLVELVASLLGDYALKISTDTLMAHKRSPQGPDADLVALKGKRFVYANETEEGRRLSDARIKELTGGDTLTGREPYAKAAVTFGPTLKLAVAGNHRPEINDMSAGMWRRVLLVPFETIIPEWSRDPQLQAKLKREGSGILNWMLAGCQIWQEGGLAVPEKIKVATGAYRDDQDVLSDFITDKCDAGVDRAVRKDVLYPAYVSWCNTNGTTPMSNCRLTRQLGDRGFRLASDKRRIHGLSLARLDPNAGFETKTA